MNDDCFLVQRRRNMTFDYHAKPGRWTDDRVTAMRYSYADARNFVDRCNRWVLNVGLSAVLEFSVVKDADDATREHGTDDLEDNGSMRVWIEGGGEPPCDW